MEQCAVHEVYDTLLEFQDELHAEFKRLDAAGAGVVTLVQWDKALTSVLSLSLSWMLLKDHFIVATDVQENCVH